MILLGGLFGCIGLGLLGIGFWRLGLRIKRGLGFVVSGAIPSPALKAEIE